MSVRCLPLSLVITTYNRPKALGVVLESVRRQSACPSEVLIADDGSGDATAAFLKVEEKRSPYALRHVWQSDRGFRPSEARNRAIAQAKHEYICMVDGDIVLHSRFIEDHYNRGEPKVLIHGSRVLLSAHATHRALTSGKLRFSWLDVLQSGYVNLLNGCYAPWASPLWTRWVDNVYSIRSCILSFFKQDYIAINGFDESYVGWGLEDNDFFIRWLRAGFRILKYKLQGMGYHLWHKGNAEAASAENQELLAATLADHGRTRCKKGISAHLLS